ncbi:TPA: acyltransferase family protein [Serratia marcescens]|nr:acyltransferase family protein [Serratia marcescens]
MLVIIGLYLAGVHNDSESYRWLTNVVKGRSYLLFNFISGIMIVYGVLTSNLISRALENSLLVYLGKLSFPIYVIHIPVIMLTIYLTRDLATTSVASMLTVSAISLVGTVLLARFVVPVDDFSISFSKRVYNKITGLRMVRRIE